MRKIPKCIHTYSSVVLKIRNPVALIFQKIHVYRFDLNAIIINPQDPLSHRTFYIYIYIYGTLHTKIAPHNI